MEDDYLSIKELADLVGVTRATINRWRADGIAPAEIKIGRNTVRFRRADVMAWLHEGEAAA